MSREQKQDLVFIATDYFAGGKEKREEMLAQPEACCDSCIDCLCDCDPECKCGCGEDCLINACGSCVAIVAHMGVFDFDVSATLSAQQGSAESGQGDVRKSMAAIGSTSASVTAGAASSVYGQTVSFWG